MAQAYYEMKMLLFEDDLLCFSILNAKNYCTLLYAT